jgi:hypothetical protein
MVMDGLERIRRELESWELESWESKPQSFTAIPNDAGFLEETIVMWRYSNGEVWAFHASPQTPADVSFTAERHSLPDFYPDPFTRHSVPLDLWKMIIEIDPLVTWTIYHKEASTKGGRNDGRE